MLVWFEVLLEGEVAVPREPRIKEDFPSMAPLVHLSGTFVQCTNFSQTGDFLFNQVRETFLSLLPNLFHKTIFLFYIIYFTSFLF